MSRGLEGRCDERDKGPQTRSEGAEHPSSAGSPESEQIGDAHGETRTEQVALRGYDNRSTDCLIAGPEDEESDDRADAGEQVAEADAECPHAHVGDVVRLHMEESLRGRSWRDRRHGSVGPRAGQHPGGARRVGEAAVPPEIVTGWLQRATPPGIHPATLLIHGVSRYHVGPVRCPNGKINLP
jgi:hypothetical protein